MLFSYDWSYLIPKLVPKGNKTKISEDSYKNIFYGAILIIVAVVIYYTAVSVFFDSLTYSFGTSYIFNYWFSNVFGLSVVPAAIIIYNKVMKDKEQNSWPFFIALIITALMILSSAYDVIDSLRSIGYSIFYLFFSLIRTAITLFGCVHLAVGCIDFCQATTAAYDPNGAPNNQQEPEVKKEEPKGGATPSADQK